MTWVFRSVHGCRRCLLLVGVLSYICTATSKKVVHHRICSPRTFTPPRAAALNTPAPAAPRGILLSRCATLGAFVLVVAQLEIAQLEIVAHCAGVATLHSEKTKVHESGHISLVDTTTTLASSGRPPAALALQRPRSATRNPSRKSPYYIRTPENYPHRLPLGHVSSRVSPGGVHGDLERVSSTVSDTATEHSSSASLAEQAVFGPSVSAPPRRTRLQLQLRLSPPNNSVSPGNTVTPDRWGAFLAPFRVETGLVG